jgi:hypothetical protein
LNRKEKRGESNRNSTAVGGEEKRKEQAENMAKADEIGGAEESLQPATTRLK